jgi:hypothetical protein
MPAITINHHAVGIAQSSIVGETLFDGIQDSPFFYLAFAIQLVEARGNLARLPRIFRTEEIDHVFCDIHSAGSVDSRSDSECDFARGQALAAELRDFQQCFQARIHSSAQRLQAQACNHAVLPH